MNMKFLIIILTAFLFIGCSQSKQELYKITDSFIESLDTTYDSYGILGADKHKKITSDGYYQVVPIGRLINVKILEPVEDEVYKKLSESLKRRYRNDGRVNDVFVNNAGTITIDCRN